jgi:hypothetical protein
LAPAAAAAESMQCMTPTMYRTPTTLVPAMSSCAQFPGLVSDRLQYQGH